MLVSTNKITVGASDRIKLADMNNSTMFINIIRDQIKLNKTPTAEFKVLLAQCSWIGSLTWLETNRDLYVYIWYRKIEIWCLHIHIGRAVLLGGIFISFSYKYIIDIKLIESTRPHEIRQKKDENFQFILDFALSPWDRCTRLTLALI